MSKETKHNIAVSIFLFALWLFLGLDYAQGELEFNSRSAKDFYFTGQTVLQILLLVFVFLKTCKIVRGLTYAWISYKIEIIYDILYNESDFELNSWLITTVLIVLYLVYYLRSLLIILRKTHLSNHWVVNLLLDKTISFLDFIIYYRNIFLSLLTSVLISLYLTYKSVLIKCKSILNYITKL